VALVIDKRSDVIGPGVHVLIVGVSDYLNLPDPDEPSLDSTWGLNKLTSPALSAFKIYECIRQSQLRLPLKTLRLLLSPSDVELKAEPALGTAGSTRAHREAFETFARAWRDDAKNVADDMTIFYFAGHGIQRGPDEGVLLLEDFLSPGPPLAKSVRVGDLWSGMAPSPTHPNIALTQFYFADACLMRPETQKKFVNPQVPDVFGAEFNVVDRRGAPVVFSTVDGAIAIGRKGKPSHFAEALALALERGAEEPEQVGGNTVWPITSITIQTALDAYYAKHKLGTNVKMGGVVGRPVIRYLSGPPDVELCVQIQPDSLASPYGVWLLDENGNAVPPCNPINRTQIEIVVKAGIYRVQVDSMQLKSSPYCSTQRFITQRVPRPWQHNLAPFLGPASP
jgi:hypothetical protein